MEVLALALREPRRYQAFLSATTEDWRVSMAERLVALGFSTDDASAMSTMYIAALRGLLLALVVTRDRARVDAAAAVVGQKLKDDLTRGPVSA
jgi:hypothetical protein